MLEFPWIDKTSESLGFDRSFIVCLLIVTAPASTTPSDHGSGSLLAFRDGLPPHSCTPFSRPGLVITKSTSLPLFMSPPHLALEAHGIFAAYPYHSPAGAQDHWDSLAKLNKKPGLAHDITL